jgi:allantoinase
MENRRYDYHPAIDRKPLTWPNDSRVALWVSPNIEYFHIDRPIPNFAMSRVPDVRSYALRDYGSRVGIFRLMEVLDKYSIRASVQLNTEVCTHHPVIIREGMKRDWEWLGHGITNNLPLTDYPPEEERQVIRQVREEITAAVGKAPRGWLGPALAETFDTPDHLAAEGFDYLCDWGFDDQPVPMRVQSGRMLVVPYEQGLNDINFFLRSNYTPKEYFRQICDQFDVLYREGERSGTVMAIPLHPFIIGIPLRIKYLDLALEYICSHDRVWLATSGDIADWYYEHYYEDPGKP